MQKFTLCVLTTCLSFTFHPLQSNAAAVISTPAVSTPAASKEANVLLLRLNEIKTMEKSGLTSSEKKNLRTEVLSIREQLRPIGGVYVSVGALILIILLLIILL